MSVMYCGDAPVAGALLQAQIQRHSTGGDDAEKATRLLVNRLLHTPSEAMRDEAARGSAGGGGWQAAEDVIRRLFGLSSRTSGDGGKNEDENT